VSSEVHPKLVGRSTAPDRDLYLVRLDDVEHWPDAIDQPKPHFVVFLAMDASAVEANSLGVFADKLIAQGMVYLCAWGPDCERVHDIFDEVRGRNTWTDEAFVMTTSHDDEELDDGLWFSLFTTLPSEEYIETCGALVAVVVDDAGWGEHVETNLTDLDRFNDEVLAREPGA
jgi:hypothetical protein